MINESQEPMILCFIYPEVCHIGYEDEEIKNVKQEDFCKYLYHLCQIKDEKHICLYGAHKDILKYEKLIRQYEEEVLKIDKQYERLTIQLFPNMKKER